VYRTRNRPAGRSPIRAKYAIAYTRTHLPVGSTTGNHAGHGAAASLPSALQTAVVDSFDRIKSALPPLISYQRLGNDRTDSWFCRIIRGVVPSRTRRDRDTVEQIQCFIRKLIENG